MKRTPNSRNPDKLSLIRDQKALRRLLHQRRRELGLSRHQLARSMGWSWSRPGSVIQRLEEGTQQPTLPTLQLWAEALDLRLALMQRKDEAR